MNPERYRHCKSDFFQISQVVGEKVFLNGSAIYGAVENNKMNEKLVSLLGGVIVSGSVFADEVLPELLVEANRIETKREETGSAISSLGAEWLLGSGVRNLESSFATLPGLTVISEGGRRGSITAVRLRGAESDHTQVLLDGVRLSDSNLTAFNFLGQESLQGLSRVTVLRGPQSALYGSEAIGGVISLQTGRGGEDVNRLWGEVGSFRTWRAGVQYGEATEAGNWFLSGSYEATDNGQPSNDFEQFLWSGRVEKNLTNGDVLGLTFRHSRVEYERLDPFSGFAVGERDGVFGSLYWRGNGNEFWNSAVTLGFYDENFEERGGFPFESDGRKWSLDWRNELSWNDRHETVVGSLAEYTDFSSSSTGGSDENWLGAFYVNHLWRPVDDLTISLGGRYENYERWDEVLTWRGTLSWQTPVEGMRVHGSYGTGFRAPSFNELFGMSSAPGFLFVGNPDLEPEESRGWDLGVEVKNKWGRFDVSYFENHLDQFINFTSVGTFPNAVSTFTNGGAARTRGLEMEASGSLLDEKVEWRLASTWLLTEDLETGEKLIRRPQWTAGFDLRGEVTEKLSLGLGGSYVGARDDLDFSAFPAARVELDDYFLLRVYGSYEFCEGLTGTLRLENVLADQYEEVEGISGRGFGVFAGFDWEF